MTLNDFNNIRLEYSLGARVIMFSLIDISANKSVLTPTNVSKVIIEYNCHICMEKNNSLAHFKCGCSLEVCQKCYVKCKLMSNKCPGCRAII